MGKTFAILVGVLLWCAPVLAGNRFISTWSMEAMTAGGVYPSCTAVPHTDGGHAFLAWSCSNTTYQGVTATISIPPELGGNSAMRLRVNWRANSTDTTKQVCWFAGIQVVPTGTLWANAQGWGAFGQGTTMDNAASNVTTVANDLIESSSSVGSLVPWNLANGNECQSGACAGKQAVLAVFRNTNNPSCSNDLAAPAEILGVFLDY